MQKINVKNVTVNKLAEMFVNYINKTSKEELLKSFESDVSDEQAENEIGKFRLIHASNEKDEYATFTASFFEDTCEVKKLIVFCVEKNTAVLSCEFKADTKSWVSTMSYANISISSIIGMSSKLRSVLL